MPPAMNRRSFVRTASLAATGLVWRPSPTQAAAPAPATESSWVSSWSVSYTHLTLPTKA